MTITTTADLVRRYRQRFRLTSSYQVAKALGVTVQAVRHWELGARTIGTPIALRMAEELNLDAAQVLGKLEAERVQRGRRGRPNEGKRERQPSQRRLALQ